MSVKLNIHPLLHHVTGDVAEIEVSGKTVGECLKAMLSRFPEARKVLLGKDGRLLNFIDVYVNGESAYPEELAKPVQDGDELHIVFAIAGG